MKALRTLTAFLFLSISIGSVFFSGCGLGPYRDVAIQTERGACNDPAISAVDVTAAREAARRQTCERTRSTEDCTPIAANARWIMTTACHGRQRWLCTSTASVIHCEADPDPVVEETP